MPVEQVRVMEEYYNALLAGDLGRANRMILMPGQGGANPVYQFAQNSQDNVDVDKYLMQVACWAFNNPAEFGLIPGEGLGGKGFMQGNAEQQMRSMVWPITGYLFSLFNHIIRKYLKRPDLKFQWVGLNPAPDQLSMAQVDQIYTQMGAYSMDYVQDRLGVPQQFRPLAPPSNPMFGSPYNPGFQTPRSLGSENDAQPFINHAIKLELGQWREKALRALKKKWPAPDFKSDILPADLKTRVRQGLVKAATPEQINAVFSAAVPQEGTGSPAPFSITHDEHLHKGPEPYHPEYAQTNVKSALERVEASLADNLARWFAALVEDLTQPAQVQKAEPGQILAVLDDATWWSIWSERLREMLINGQIAAAQAGQKTVERQLQAKLSWDYLQPAVLAWASQQAADLVRRIEQDVKDRLKAQITSGLADGKTLFAIRDEIAALKNGKEQSVFSAERALTIARTEVIRAHAKGAETGYKESGMVRGIKWLDGQSGACPKCRTLHNKVVPLGETFYTDPHFGNGLPPRHPNCRCAISPVTIDQAKHLPADHPLRNDQRDSFEQLTDFNTYTLINNVRVTGERKWHWETRHPDAKEYTPLVPDALSGTIEIADWKVRGSVKDVFIDLGKVNRKGKPLYYRIVIQNEDPAHPFVLTAHVTSQK